MSVRYADVMPICRRTLQKNIERYHIDNRLKGYAKARIGAKANFCMHKVVKFLMRL